MIRINRVTAAPSSTRGACSCWVWVSIPAALRMKLDSLAPFSGSRIVNSSSATGMPVTATMSPHRQLWVTVATQPTKRMPIVWDRGSARLCHANTRARAWVG